MNFYKALRLKAIGSVQSADEEANLRHIFRWYSHQFHTPLHQVEELPLDEVLLHFYEHTYEEMSDEERQKEIDELIETVEERRARERAKDEERAEAFMFAQFSAEEQRKKEEAEAKKIADLKPEERRALAVREAPEASLPKPKIVKSEDLTEIPPDIEMKFVSDSEFEAELEAESMLPRKPQSSQ